MKNKITEHFEFNEDNVFQTLMNAIDGFISRNNDKYPNVINLHQKRFEFIRGKFKKILQRELLSINKTNDFIEYSDIQIEDNNGQTYEIYLTGISSCYYVNITDIYNRQTELFVKITDNIDFNEFSLIYNLNNLDIADNEDEEEQKCKEYKFDNNINVFGNIVNAVDDYIYTYKCLPNIFIVHEDKFNDLESQYNKGMLKEENYKIEAGMFAEISIKFTEEGDIELILNGKMKGKIKTYHATDLTKDDFVLLYDEEWFSDNNDNNDDNDGSDDLTPQDTPVGTKVLVEA